MKSPLNIVTVGCLLLAPPSCAQRITPVFGTLTDADKALETYTPEPEAPAVVIFDIGDAFFADTNEGGYNIRFTRTKRTKIFNRSAIEEEATVAIPYYEEPGKSERVVSIEANTYNLREGLTYKTSLDPKTVFEQQVNNRVKVKKFVFPDVKEGSIIEYKYVLETPFHFNLPDWEFQGNVPALYSEYTVRMIPFYEYTFVAQGITKFDYQHSEESTKKRKWGNVTEGVGLPLGGVTFGDMVHAYVMKNVPSFKDVPYISSREDYIMKVDFQLSKFYRPTGGSENIISTWPELCKGLLAHEHFGKYLSSSVRLGKKILEDQKVLSGELTEEKKAEQIVGYVRSNFSWNGNPGRYASKSAKEFVEQKSGNVTDINLFLVGMLKAAGLNAEPVMISTRPHGRILSDFPFEHYFNATIALVTGQRMFLMDATETRLAYDRLPVRCINEKGLVVNEKESRWVTLSASASSLDERQVTLKIDPDKAVAHVSGKITATEHEAVWYKEKFNNDSIRFRDYLQKEQNIEPVAVKFYNFDKPKIPYVMMFAGTVPLDKAGSKILVQPLLRLSLTENPLRQATRTFPVDFVYPQINKLQSTIFIPDGYRVESLPQHTSLDNEIAQVRLSFQLIENEVRVQADYTMKKAIYASSEYGKLKSTLQTVVIEFNVPVVLEKK